MSEVEIFLMLLATVGGALVSALLGWYEANEPFDHVKFVPSMMRAVISGMVTAVTVVLVPEVTSVGVLSYVGAFLAGLGIEAGLNRISGGVSKRY